MVTCQVDVSIQHALLLFFAQSAKCGRWSGPRKRQSESKSFGAVSFRWLLISTDMRAALFPQANRRRPKAWSVSLISDRFLFVSCVWFSSHTHLPHNLTDNDEMYVFDGHPHWLSALLAKQILHAEFYKWKHFAPTHSDTLFIGQAVECGVLIRVCVCVCMLTGRS